MKYVSGSETSIAAAVSVEPSIASWQGKVLALLREGDGLTDEEMQARLGLNPSTQRPRRIELVEAGLVRDSGQRRRTRSGRWAVVWSFAPVQRKLM